MAFRAGDMLRATVLNEDDRDMLLSADGHAERFLVDKASGAVYLMGAAGAAATNPHEIGAWRAADSSIVIISPTGPLDGTPFVKPEPEPEPEDDEEDEGTEDEDGEEDESPPPLPGVARLGASAFGAAPPPMQSATAQPSPIFKPAARPPLSRPGTVAQPARREAPPPLPTAQQVAAAKLLAAELGSSGEELEAAKARIATLQLDTPAGREMAGLAREVKFSAGKLGMSLVANDSFMGAGAKGGLQVGDRYSTVVQKLNWNADGSQGQAGASGKVKPEDLVVSVEGEDLLGLSYEDVSERIKRAPRPCRIGFNDVETMARVLAPTEPEAADAAAAPSGMPLELDDEEAAEAKAVLEETLHAQQWSVRMEAKLAVPEPEPDPLDQPEAFWNARIAGAQRSALELSPAAGDEPPPLPAVQPNPEPAGGLEDSMTKIEMIKAEIRAAERLKEEMWRQDVHGHKAKLAVTAVERAVFAGGKAADGGEELSSIFAAGNDSDAVHLDQSAKIDTLPSPTRFSDWENQLAAQEAWVAEDEARQYRYKQHAVEADKRALARRFQRWRELLSERRRHESSVSIGNAIVNRRYLKHALARWRIVVMRSNPPRKAGEPGNLSPINVRGGSPSKKYGNEDLTLSPVRRAEQVVASPVRFTVKATGLDPSTTLNLDWSEMSSMSTKEVQKFTEATASSIGLSMVSSPSSRNPYRSTSASANTADGTALDVETWQAAGTVSSVTGVVEPEQLQRLVELGRLGVYNEMRRQQHESATTIQKWARVKLAKSFVQRYKDQLEQERLDEMEQVLNEEMELMDWAATTIQARARGNIGRARYWAQVEAEEELIRSEIAAAAVQARWRGMKARATQRALVVNQAQSFMLTLKNQAQAKKTQEMYAQVEIERQERLKLEAQRAQEKRKQAGHISALKIAHQEAQAVAEQRRAVHAEERAAAEAAAKVLAEEESAAIAIQATIRGQQLREAQADEEARRNLAGSQMNMDLTEWLKQNGYRGDALATSLSNAGAKTPRDVLGMAEQASDLVKFMPDDDGDDDGDGTSSQSQPEPEPEPEVAGGSGSNDSGLVLIGADGMRMKPKDGLVLGRGAGCAVDDKALSKEHSHVKKSSIHFVSGYQAGYEIVPQGKKNAVKIERSDGVLVIGGDAEVKTAMLKAGDVLTLGKGLNVKMSPARQIRVEIDETPQQKRQRDANVLWKQLKAVAEEEDKLLRGLRAAEKLKKADQERALAAHRAYFASSVPPETIEAVESIAKTLSGPEIAEGTPPVTPAEMKKAVERVESAAVRIQARYRGNSAREAYWQMVEDDIVRLEAEAAEEAEMAEMDEAATKIQSRIRGQQAQRALDGKLRMEESRQLAAQEEETAAVKIQARIRGKKTRTESAEAEAEAEAALNDTSFLDRDIGEWLTEHGEAALVDKMKNEFGASTLRDLEAVIQERDDFVIFIPRESSPGKKKKNKKNQQQQASRSSSAEERWENLWQALAGEKEKVEECLRLKQEAEEAKAEAREAALEEARALKIAAEEAAKEEEEVIRMGSATAAPTPEPEPEPEPEVAAVQAAAPAAPAAAVVPLDDSGLEEETARVRAEVMQRIAEEEQRIMTQREEQREELRLAAAEAEAEAAEVAREAAAATERDRVERELANRAVADRRIAVRTHQLTTHAHAHARVHAAPAKCHLQADFSPQHC
jgi:hypothetical protein